MQPDKDYSPENPYKFHEKAREKYLDLLRRGNGRYAAARALGIDPRTVRRWVKGHPEFQDEIEIAEAESAEEIVDAHFETAKKGNVTAQLNIMYNKLSDQWKDHRRPSKVEISGKVEHELTAGPAIERIAALQDRLTERAQIVDAEIVDDDPKELESGDD